MAGGDVVVSAPRGASGVLLEAFSSASDASSPAIFALSAASSAAISSALGAARAVVANEAANRAATSETLDIRKLLELT